MRRNQFSITYPEGDAQQLHHTLHLLKRSWHLNLSAFFRAGIADKLERLEKKMKIITMRLPDVEAAMLIEVQKRNMAFKDLQ